MNKRNPYVVKKLKQQGRSNWIPAGTTPFSLRKRNEGKRNEENGDSLSLGETIAANTRSFNALRMLSGSGGNLDDPIRIQRSKPPKNAAALQP